MHLDVLRCRMGSHNVKCQHFPHCMYSWIAMTYTYVHVYTYVIGVCHHYDSCEIDFIKRLCIMQLNVMIFVSDARQNSGSFSNKTHTKNN
jgi:hypothetical protein